MGAGRRMPRSRCRPTRSAPADLDPDASTRKLRSAGEEFDKKQMELIQKVNAYFNQMSEIKGLFVQTSADNKRQRGKFYVKRPGRFRFDYNLPSRLVILSDGQYMADPGPRHEDRRPRRARPDAVPASCCARTSTCCGMPASSRSERSTT